MKNEQAVKAAFEYAAERYAAIGVDVNEVLKKMQGISSVSYTHLTLPTKLEV